ncbi:protein EMBRYONIC FLOWER 1-like [Macadamia integrifolia]|uniref:protein EMBRYONIC FLOWER 1-like n=1 Tax=Macadamia integrifolia TaxID=60698 RepID=UPI001C4E72AE|nr:protein EMBRYONIC FLOWER 1-like [Macadamia integrifolia]XP_042513177.1 protein EMBRYONIC FLOWER 1-like [Macadamia integrifolia]XP_042513178.1 protein EMBRYONIC FLOWER 1-like [Macadamia integrifolia]
MDKSAVEGNCNKSDLTPVVNSSVTQIVAAEKYKADGCSHFSIRGYVAEVRKKDKKICWPFSIVGDHNKLEEKIMLPPIHVPKFRQWNCQNCLRKIGANDTPNETGMVTNCCNRVTIPSPGFQESSEVNIVGKRKTISDVLLHIVNKKKKVDNRKSSSRVSLRIANKKKKKDEVMDPITGGENKNLEIFWSPYSVKSGENRFVEVSCTIGSGFELVVDLGAVGPHENVNTTGELNDDRQDPPSSNGDPCLDHDTEISVVRSAFQNMQI